MIGMPFGLKSIVEIARAPSWTQEQFLNGIVPNPWRGLLGDWVKPRVRVKMGRNVVTVRDARNQCQRKTPYDAMQQAFDAMVANHGKRTEYNIYECPHCQKWHVGHRERSAA